jgi:hypothetical protein
MSDADTDQQTDEDRVRTDLETAKAAWNSGHRRSRIYGYLQTVFDIGQRWKEEEKGIRYQVRMLKITNFKMGERLRGRFRVIVYCTSEPKSKSDFKLRNKWVQWLELKSKTPTDQSFEQFVKARGNLSDAPPRAR